MLTQRTKESAASMLWLPEGGERRWGGFNKDPLLSSRNPSGLRITPDNSLRSTVVLACCRILGESVASLPLNLFRKLKDGGKEIADDVPLYGLLHDAPNSWQTSYEWREQMMLHCCLWGQAFSYLKPGELGAVSEIIPLHPSRMTVERLPTGRLRYQYSEEAGKVTTFSQDQIMHLRWLSDDGVNGMIPTELASDAIALSRACEIHGSSFFGNGARPGIVLETEQVLEQSAAHALRDNWERMHRGADNANRTAVLMGGLKAHEINSSHTDSQFIETRRMQIEECCRIFRIPPHLVGDLTRSSFSNIEQQSIDFLNQTLNPWLMRIQAVIGRDVISDSPEYFVEFDPRGMLRGDVAARASYMNTVWNLGVASINEIRDWEGLNPIEGGEQRFVQLNMQTLEQSEASSRLAITEAETAEKQADEEETCEDCGGENGSEENGESLESGPDTSNPPGEETVQQVSLNGAQITSLIQILEQYSGGLIEESAAKSLIASAFPSIPEKNIDEFVAGTIVKPPEQPQQQGPEGQQQVPAEEQEPVASIDPQEGGLVVEEDEELEEVEDPLLEGRNCGTGASSGKKGFQKGNNCAGKGGGEGGGAGGGGEQEQQGSGGGASADSVASSGGGGGAEPLNPSGKDTLEQHTGKDGKLDPRRSKLHDRIVSETVDGVGESEDPTLYLMGGGPASGKSSIIRSGDVEHPSDHVLANSDEFKPKLPEYNKEIAAGNSDKAAAFVHEESSLVNNKVMVASASGNKDTVWDGTGDSSIEKLEAKVKVFKDKGFKVKADYVTVDTDVAVSRSAARAKKTGRNVPVDVIRDTHAQVSNIYPKAVARGLFDESTLWDTNAGGKPVKIASSKGRRLTVHNRTLYDQFLRKAGSYGPRDGDGDGIVNEEEG